MNQVSEFLQILDEIKHKRVAVVGDVFIDEYSFGKASGISSGIPSPIIQKQHTEYCLGGAGNVAANITGLGAECTLICRIGRDAHSETLYALASKHGIAMQPYNTKYNTVKQRVYNGEHQLLRIDSDHPVEPVAQALGEKLARIRPHLIIVADYRLGAIDQCVIDILGNYAHKHMIPFVFNSRNPGQFNFACASAAVLSQNDIDNTLYPIQKLQEDGLDCFVTMGKNGIRLGECISPASREDFRCNRCINVSGAGDSVLAAIGLLYGERICVQDLLHIANLVGRLAVSNPLTYTLTRSELISSFFDSAILSCAMNKVLPEKHAANILEIWSKCGMATRILRMDCSCSADSLYKIILPAYSPWGKLVVDARGSICVDRAFIRMAESNIVDLVILPDFPPHTAQL